MCYACLVSVTCASGCGAGAACCTGSPAGGTAAVCAMTGSVIWPLRLRRRRRCVHAFFLRRHVHGVGFINGLFEPFDGFAQSFSQLRDFSRPEDNEDDEQDEQ